MNSKENRMLIKNGIFLKKKIKNVVVGDSSYYYDKGNRILVKDTVKKAFMSIEKTFGNKDRIAYIESNKRFVKCNTEAIKHGIIKVKDNENYRSNSFIISNIGPLIKKSMKINETKPTIDYLKGQDIYLSIISDTYGNIYPTRIIVNKDTSIIDKIEYIDKLKAIKGIKKERIPHVMSTLEVGNVLSSISLEQLANEVKYKYSDSLPNILLKKFKVNREETRLSVNVIF